MAQQELQFDGRFLDRYAGALLSDAAVAIVELVANAWDAYATEVHISWPDRENNVSFSISDNGEGMSAEQLQLRWNTFDYNRHKAQATQPPAFWDVGAPTRRPYGRNGRGRHAAFRFGDPYQVTTVHQGKVTTFEIARGTTRPFEIRLLSQAETLAASGTTILAPKAIGVGMTADEAREVIGTRFLADPKFRVSVDGTAVSFDDIPTNMLRSSEVTIEKLGVATIYMVDTRRSDRTTHQHGIAWRVGNRLVGKTSWSGLFDKRILDGRSAEAKRFTFIVFADFLENAVLPDWTAFQNESDDWKRTQTAVHGKISEMLASVTDEERTETKADIHANLERTISKLGPLGRDRWTQFVNQVVDSCPTITPNEVQQVADILANLEISTSRYGLISKLHNLRPGDLDNLDGILSDWTLDSAKIALDEIQGRLSLLEEIDAKLRDSTSSEVQELQPLFDRSLWVFGPEFESIEFTSNKGMTQVISSLFGQDTAGSRNRPDFVILPDGTAGLYSRDSFDEQMEANGVARLVIVEIKKPGIRIGEEQKSQAWKYAKELRTRGLITDGTRTTCFVLGSEIEAGESAPRKELDDIVVIIPMTYQTFIRRAEARMLGLREKLSNAPFLKEKGLDGAEFIAPIVPAQTEMAV